MESHFLKLLEIKRQQLAALNERHRQKREMIVRELVALEDDALRQKTKLKEKIRLLRLSGEN